MQGSKSLFLLSLGLCLVLEYTKAVGEPQIDGGIFYNLNVNIEKQLEDLNKMQVSLETRLKNSWNMVEKAVLQGDLYNVKKAIAYIHQKATVPRKEFIEMKMKQKAQYEKEMKEMRTKFEKARKEETAKEYAAYKNSYDKLAAAKNKIESEFSKYANDAKLNELRITKIKNELQQEKEETIKTLEAAKQKHARAVEALTANMNEGYKPVQIPQQVTINGLKQDLKTFVNIKDRKKQNEGLLLTKTTLTSLLPALYEGSKFLPDTDRQDMEDALAVMEMNTAVLKAEQHKQRNELLGKMKNKDLSDLSDNEIDSIQKINEELAVSEAFQQEVVTRSAYLKGLLEVSGLIQECSDAIEALKQGKIVNFLTDAIEEAKNGNLAKLWTFA